MTPFAIIVIEQLPGSFGRRVPARQIDLPVFRPKRIVQMRSRHAPALFCRAVSPGQRHITQMSAPFEPGVVANQKLAAPDPAVRPEPGAVECHADDLFPQAVLRHATRDVRMVMLNGELRFRPAHRPPRAQIVGMKIVRNQARRRLISALQVT